MLLKPWSILEIFENFYFGTLYPIYWQLSYKMEIFILDSVFFAMFCEGL
jgi:hypothetical protein